MIFSQSTKEQKHKVAKKYRKVITHDGLVIYEKETPTTFRFTRKETEKILKRKIDFSKFDHYCEVAHLEISNNCNLRCKYCYVPNKHGRELSTAKWKKIIHNLADYGIFQVTFGGGEPTLRKDLFELAEIVRRTGMNLGMTTNGLKLPQLNSHKLRKYFKQINVSWHGNSDIFEEALEYLYKNNIPAGINYTYTIKYARDNDMIKFLADEYGAEILYLVYKPVINDWRNQISGKDVYKVAKQAANEGLKVAVDGPCIDKCLMKKKFIDVDHLGNVLPCSFVRKPLGNLLKQSLKTIWANRGKQVECPFVKLRKE